MTLALIDATRHGTGVPAGTRVAGLTLLERALRLVSVVGASRAVICAGDEETAESLGTLVDDTDADVSVELVAGDLNRGLGYARSEGGSEPLLAIASHVAYRRQLVDRVHQAVSEDGPGAPNLTVGQAASPSGDRGVAPVLAAKPSGLETVATHLAEAESRTLSDLIERLAEQAAPIEEPRGWFVPVIDETSARVAERRLWDDCRKPVDGIVARHWNRNVSLAVSRRIARFDISPNLISVLTFPTAIIAAGFATLGTFWAFLAAGVFYHINGIADGIDGEIARVKYEFSVTGEWVDTVTDDLKDVFFYAGLGWGAWAAGLPSVAGAGAPLWATLGAVAVTGKLISMAGYYSFLIARGRGDMYAFQWSFEDADEQQESTVSRLLSNLKYLTKDDFAVFLAMCLGFVGLMPWFLVFAAIGQVVVALSVLVQRLVGIDSDD